MRRNARSAITFRLLREHVVNRVLQHTVSSLPKHRRENTLRSAADIPVVTDADDAATVCAFCRSKNPSSFRIVKNRLPPLVYHRCLRCRRVWQRRTPHIHGQT
jgi:hypothetical protein